MQVTKQVFNFPTELYHFISDKIHICDQIIIGLVKDANI